MICPNCGAQADEGMRFCTNCGFEMRPAAAPGEPGAGRPEAGLPPTVQPPPSLSSEGGDPRRPPAAPAQQRTVSREPQARSHEAPPSQAGPSGEEPTAPMRVQPAAPRGPAGAPGSRPAGAQPPGRPPTYGQPQPTGRLPAQQYQYPRPARVAPQYGPRYAPSPSYVAARGNAPLGILGLLSGAGIAASTFLSWFSVIGFSATGWEIMRSGGSTGVHGNEGVYVFMSGEGIIFFTGFVSLLLGVLVAVGGLVMLFRARAGGVVTVVFGLCAGCAAAINIAMVLSKMPQVSPDIGLWLFAGASAIALVLGITGIAVG